MNTHLPRGLFRKLATTVLAGSCFASQPCLAADEAGAPKGAAGTLLEAAKQCLLTVVEVFRVPIPKDQNPVRPGTARPERRRSAGGRRRDRDRRSSAGPA